MACVCIIIEKALGTLNLGRATHSVDVESGEQLAAGVAAILREWWPEGGREPPVGERVTVTFRRTEGPGQ